MYILYDLTPWTQRTTWYADQHEARSEFEERCANHEHDTFPWLVELRQGEEFLLTAGTANRDEMYRLIADTHRAFAQAFPERFSGHGVVHYVVSGDELVRSVDEDECRCVLPEQSCAACRAAAARAAYLPWD